MSLVPVTAARDSKESGVTKVTYRRQGAWTGWKGPNSWWLPRVPSRPVEFRDTTFYSQFSVYLYRLVVARMNHKLVLGKDAKSG